MDNKKKKGRIYFSLVVGSSPPTKKIENSQKGELSCPEKTAGPRGRRKTSLLSWPRLSEEPRTLFTLTLPNFPFFSTEGFSSLFHVGKLHMVYHCFRPELQFCADPKYAHHCWRSWRRLLRVPWTARRSNQSILKEISPGISLEGMMLKLKLQYFGHLM